MLSLPVVEAVGGMQDNECKGLTQHESVVLKTGVISNFENYPQPPIIIWCLLSEFMNCSMPPRKAKLSSFVPGRHRSLFP